MNNKNSVQHDNGLGQPPIGAYDCGCDNTSPRIHEWESGPVVVATSYCGNCGRMISLRIESQQRMIDRDITPDDK